MTGSPFFLATQSVSGGVSVPNPIAHWPLEETSGTSVPDTSGNGYNGTCYNGHQTVGNGPTWTNDGTRGNCLTFDGTNDFVGCPNFNEVDGFTTMAWINPGFTNTYKTITCRRNGAQNSENDSSNRQWNFQVNASNIITLVIYSTGSTFQTVNGTATIAQNTWQHVAAVYAGVNQLSRMYVNGVLGGTNTITAAMNQTADLHFQIGARTSNTTTRYWQGMIDDVRHYSEPLTTEQVQAIYNATVL